MATATDEKSFLTFDEAVSRLPDGDDIHTFRNGGGILIGADWSRTDLIEALKAAKAIEETGQAAQSMKHGIAIEDSHGWLFIATK